MKEENDLQNLLVKVIFYTKYEIIKEEKISIDTTFERIIDYFNNNVKIAQNEFGNVGFNLKSSYKLNNTNIKNEDTIKSLIESTDISELSEIKLCLEIEEIKKPTDNIINNLDEEINIIYKPKSNPFSIFSFNIKLGIVTLEPYAENIVTLYELNKFNSSSAYCNSPNDLFISGGNSDNIISNNFWIVDNNKKSITKKEMPFQKANHSMIYLKEKYILITGGDDLKSFFYDINKNSFIVCGDLSNKCSKPALFRYNDYIYCLSDLNEEKQFFERLCLKEDLSLSYWEKIYPCFGNELDSEFNIKNFGVTSELYNGFIVLGGGNLIKNTTYVYDVENNILSLSDGKNEKVYLEEKTFYKYENDKNYFVNFSGDFEKKQEIVFINQKNKSVLLVDVDSMDGTINMDKINENNESVKKEEIKNMTGNISIRVLFKKKENENLKYKIFGEKITPILDDILDEINEININENNINMINENDVDNNKKNQDLNNININQNNDEQNKNINNDDNDINVYKSKTDNYIKLENENDKKEDKKHKKLGLNKMTKAIKGIFKHKNKDKDKNKKDGNEEIEEEDDKEKNEENENDTSYKKSKTNKAKKYLGKLKNKLMKKRESSSVNKNKKKVKEEEKRERNNSLSMKITKKDE